MKFGKEWKVASMDLWNDTSLPSALRDVCIDYRAWKKKTSSSSSPSTTRMLLEALDLQVAALDKAYSREVKSMSVNKSAMINRLSACFQGRDDTDVARWCRLHAYAALNRKAVYKIAKRIDKHCRSESAETAIRWYRAQKSTRDGYGVMANDHTWKLLLLRSRQPEAEEACPVCLEDTYEKRVILRCGHVICKECVLDMVGGRGKRGTFHNLVNAYMYGGSRDGAAAVGGRRCPMCRCEEAFSKFEEYTASP